MDANQERRLLVNYLRSGIARATERKLGLGFLAMSVEVSDEGGYWKDRDVQKLANEVGDWNAMIAAFGGFIKDKVQGSGIALELPIAGYPNFEHLEMKGQDRLKELRARLGLG